jgi:hypothetical protein
MVCLLNKSHILTVPSPYEAASLRFSRKERERTSKEDPVSGKRSEDKKVKIKFNKNQIK